MIICDDCVYHGSDLMTGFGFVLGLVSVGKGLGWIWV